MAQITIYKPNGETLQTLNDIPYEVEGPVLTIYHPPATGEQRGKILKTSLPFTVEEAALPVDPEREFQRAVPHRTDYDPLDSIDRIG
jgi:hypothetical protein